MRVIHEHVMVLRCNLHEDTMTNVTLKLIPLAKLDDFIGSIHKRGQSLQHDMHRAACSVIAALGEHKDTRIVMPFVHKIINAMPEMARVNGLKAWFEAHAPVKFIEEQGSPMQVVYVKGGKFKLGDAISKPFWKFNAKEGVPYEPLDLDKFEAQMIAKLLKDQKETGRDHSARINALKGYNIPAPVNADPLAQTNV